MDMERTQVMEAEKNTQENGMAAVLKVCPFCGSYQIDPEGGLGADKDGTMRTFPVCDNCHATAPSVEAWNRRTITVDMALKASDAIDHCLDDETLNLALVAALSSDEDLIGYTQMAELLGVETTEDYRQMVSMDRSDTETGYWLNLRNGYFQHFRTADF
jgi:hypothetical protein